jgi:hypothetical protein
MCKGEESGGQGATDQIILRSGLAHTFDLPGGGFCGKYSQTLSQEICGNYSHKVLWCFRARQRMAGLDPPNGGKGPAPLTEISAA